MTAGAEAALHRNLPGRALLYMVAGVAAFSWLDAGAKWLTYGYAVAQIIFVGRCFTFLTILAICLPQRNHGRLFSFRRPVLQLVRAVTGVLTMATFFWALALMPLANVIAIAFAAPLFMTVLGATVLGEKVGPRRWGALMVGFAGVLIIARPGSEGFGWPVLLPLSSALFYAVSNILSRRLTATESTESLMIWITGTAILCTAPFMPFQWVTPGPLDLAVFLFTGLASGAGQFLMLRAFRYGEISMLAPIEYTALVWATTLGFFIWGEVPHWSIWIGAAIVAGASLYIAHSETGLGRRRIAETAVPGEGAP